MTIMAVQGDLTTRVGITTKGYPSRECSGFDDDGGERNSTMAIGKKSAWVVLYRRIPSRQRITVVFEAPRACFGSIHL